MRDNGVLPSADRPISSDIDGPDPGTTPGQGDGRQVGLRAYLVALVILVLAPALLHSAAITWELGSAYRHSEEAGLASTA